MPQLGYLPDTPLQFAHYLASVLPRRGSLPLKVQARIYVSIKGRKPVLYINPITDLAAEQRTLGRPQWLLRNDEPLQPREKRYELDLFSRYTMEFSGDLSRKKKFEIGGIAPAFIARRKLGAQTN